MVYPDTRTDDHILDRASGKSSGQKEMMENLYSLVIVVSIAAMILILLSVLSSDSSAETIVVDQKGEGDYIDILPAIFAANEGDTIEVKNGNYSAEFLTNKLTDNITLIGEDDQETRLILGEYSRLFMESNFTMVKGFNITGAGTFLNYLCLYKGTNMKITDCNLYNITTILITYDAYECEISNNKLTGTVISLFTHDLEHARSHRIDNNTIHGKPFHYLVDQKDRTIYQSDGGYLLINCTNITFESIELDMNSGGIGIELSSDITILNSTLQALQYPLSSYHSHSIRVINCSFFDTVSDEQYYYSYSLFLYNTTHFSVQDSTFYSDAMIMMGGENELHNNTFMDHCGIFLEYASRCKITNNKMKDGGIRFENEFSPSSIENYTHTIVNNTIAGKPIYYYRGQQDIIVPDNAGQVIMINSSDMTIDGVEISDVDRGILMFMTTGSTIRNSRIEKCDYPIYITESSGNLVENCQIVDTDNNVFIHGTTGNTLRGCELFNTTLHLYGTGNIIDDCVLVSAENSTNTIGIFCNGQQTLTGLQIKGYGTGIRLTGATVSIIDTMISQNHVGLRLVAGSDVQVSDSTFSYNHDKGVLVDENNKIELTNCIIGWNTGSGLVIHGRDAVVTGCTITRNMMGIGVQGDNGTIFNCDVIQNNDVGIYINGGGQPTIDNCTIEGNPDGIYLEEVKDFIIRWSTISANQGMGIKIYDYSEGEIRDTLVSDSEYAIHMENSRVDIYGCRIFTNTNGIHVIRPTNNIVIKDTTLDGNTEYGVNTGSANYIYEVDARFNYWGDPSGPYHVSDNRDGKGDQVGEGITYSPWYQTASLTDVADEEEDEDHNTLTLLAILSIIAVLLICLDYVVRTPEEKLRRLWKEKKE